MKPIVHLALFKEDQVDQAAEAIAHLRKLGLRDKEISVVSGVPYSDKILGRPQSWTRIPIIALSGAVIGFLLAFALNVLTQWQYPLRVGGQPFVAIPTSIVVTFELTMLGLLISTFLGVFIETIAPSGGPKGYHPRISDGCIGIFYTCQDKLEMPSQQALRKLGAEIVAEWEVTQ